MKSKVWNCKLDHEMRLIAKDPTTARVEFLRLLFEHPERVHVETTYIQDVEVPEKKEVQP